MNKENVIKEIENKFVETEEKVVEILRSIDESDRFYIQKLSTIKDISEMFLRFIVELSGRVSMIQDEKELQNFVSELIYSGRVMIKSGENLINK